MKKILQNETEVNKKPKSGNILKICLCALLCLITLCSCTLQFGLDDGKSESQKDLKVHFIDVGQGDSIFVELPNGQNMLIDAGEKEYKTKVESYIKDCGYSKIDFLVASHPHSDHIGGLSHIVDAFDINNVYMPKVLHNTKTFEKLLQAISDKGLKIKNAVAVENMLKEDNLSMDIIGPVEIDEEELNNSSAVIKLTYGETSFLFLGDAEKEELNSIKADMSATVLKVAHHGSKTSTYTEFLNKVRPSVAVISVNDENSYNHPNKDVVKMLEQSGAKLYRTDFDGTVVVTSNAEKVSVETEK